MSTLNTFDVNIVGADASPTPISFSELLTVLQSVQGLVESFAEPPDERPELAVKSVSPSGESWSFLGNDAALSAERRLALALEAGNLKALPERAQRHLQQLAALLSRHDEDVSVQLFAGQARPFIVTKSLEFQTPRTLVGRTTLDCLGVGVGRDETGPNAVVKLDDGRRLTIRLSDERLAREVETRLQQRWELDGDAEWDAGTWRLVGFHAESLVASRSVGVDIVAGLQRLEAIAPGRWNGVDPQAFVDEMRGDDALDRH